MIRYKESNFDREKLSSVLTKNDGQKYKLEWFDDTDFSKLENVKQVYGYILDESGKLLIVNPGTTWRLPGGGPEPEDKTHEETLIRETIEEADAILENIKPIGYIKITPFDPEDKVGVHYVLRYVAKLKRLDKQTIDVAINAINERILIETKDFSKYCDWGEMGLHILEKAIKEFEK